MTAHDMRSTDPRSWLLPGAKINSVQQDSIKRLVTLAKHAHHVDVIVRINGEDRAFQADWLKHLSEFSI